MNVEGTHLQDPLRLRVQLHHFLFVRGTSHHIVHVEGLNQPLDQVRMRILMLLQMVSDGRVQKKWVRANIKDDSGEFEGSNGRFLISDIIHPQEAQGILVFWFHARQP